MAEEVGKIRISLLLGVDDFKKSLNRISGDFIKFNKTMLGTTVKVGAATLALGAAGLLGVIYKTTKAAAEEQVVFSRLGATVDNLGISYNSVSGELNSLFAEIQRTTKYGDDESAAALQRLVVITGDYEGSVKGLTSVLDFASAMQIDYNTAARLAGQAVSGNIGALSRYGIVLDDATKNQLKNATAAERANIIYGLLNEKFGGAASAELNTYAGAVKQMTNYWGDLQEEIGNRFLPIFTEAMNKTSGMLKDIIPVVGQVTDDFITIFSKGMEGLPEIAGLAGTLAGEAFLSSWQLLGTVFADVLYPIFKYAITELVGRLAVGINEGFASAFEKLPGVGDKIAGYFRENADLVQQTVEDFQLDTSGFDRFSKRAKEIFTEFGTSARARISDLADNIRKDMPDAGEKGGKGFGNNFSAGVEDGVTKAGGSIDTFTKKLIDAQKQFTQLIGGESLAKFNFEEALSKYEDFFKKGLITAEQFAQAKFEIEKKYIEDLTGVYKKEAEEWKQTMDSVIGQGDQYAPDEGSYILPDDSEKADFADWLNQTESEALGKARDTFAKGLDWTSLGSQIGGGFQNALNAFLEGDFLGMFQSIFGEGGMFGGLKDLFSGGGGFFDNIGNMFSQGFGGLKDAFSGGFEGIMSGLSSAGALVSSILTIGSSIVGAISTYFQEKATDQRTRRILEELMNKFYEGAAGNQEMFDNFLRTMEYHSMRQDEASQEAVSRMMDRMGTLWEEMSARAATGDAEAKGWIEYLANMMQEALSRGDISPELKSFYEGLLDEYGKTGESVAGEHSKLMDNYHDEKKKMFTNINDEVTTSADHQRKETTRAIDIAGKEVQRLAEIEGMTNQRNQNALFNMMQRSNKKYSDAFDAMSEQHKTGLGQLYENMSAVVKETENTIRVLKGEVLTTSGYQQKGIVDTFGTLMGSIQDYFDSLPKGSGGKLPGFQHGGILPRTDIFFGHEGEGVLSLHGLQNLGRGVVNLMNAGNVFKQPGSIATAPSMGSITGSIVEIGNSSLGKLANIIASNPGKTTNVTVSGGMSSGDLRGIMRAIEEDKYGDTYKPIGVSTGTTIYPENHYNED